MKGFISDDGNYGVFPYGKQWMVIYHNEQLEVFKTLTQCKKYIKQHQDTLKTEPPKKQKSKRCPRVKQDPKIQPRKSTKKK
jgi:hypothetical protein